jgi:protocadherin-16/23
VSAIDPDCGGNAARVQYSIPNNLGFPVPTELYVKSDTGEICIKQPLDYETKHLYEFPIMASDKGKNNS